MLGLSNLLKTKSSNKSKLLNSYGFKNKKLPIWLIDIDELFIDNILIDALKILPANFIVFWEWEKFGSLDNICFIQKSKNLIDSGFDFIVTCDDDLLKYMKIWITPITSKSNSLWGILKEFNAWVVEWNSFIFENESLCDIYYAIIRYVENFKFPYDNKALIKNILSI